MPRPAPPLQPKLLPPRFHNRLLPRPRIMARLRQSLDYRLTLVQAGTGYGKSTALAGLSTLPAPLFWYSLDEADSDPQHFLTHLIGTFASHLPLSNAPSAALQEVTSNSSEHWEGVLDTLINDLTELLKQPGWLVFDDYDFVANTRAVHALTERLLQYCPPNLHIVIASHNLITSPAIANWRVRGEVLEINRNQLAFETGEIESLFRETYRHELTAGQVALLYHKTEGWPIALQLIWQGQRDGPVKDTTSFMEAVPVSLNALFDYLARNVLERQSVSIRSFLLDTAVLQELTPESCDSVTSGSNSADLLGQLVALDLFIVTLGERHYRYHHLFHDFLQEQLSSNTGRQRHCHQQAARFFEATGQLEQAVHHWIEAGNYESAATTLETGGEIWLREGRLKTILRWIDLLPPDLIAQHPRLQVYLGDTYRLQSRFEEALGWYAEAERTWRARGDLMGVSQALRGQALIYLDTVRPARAETLLQDALRITDGMADREARARLLELLAENKLNMGKPDEAEALRAEARTLREEGPAEDVLSVRVKLRTGRLDDAQQILEAWNDSERRANARGESHSPRAHRETSLILSLLHSFRGQAVQAAEFARDGIDQGERVNSPFITAVAYMRLGHAFQLQTVNGFVPAYNYQSAIEAYNTSIALGNQLSVQRTRVEALWGLTRAYGFSGALESAENAATEGAAIGRRAGDLWIVALTELALGAGYILAHRSEAAVEVLARVLQTFRDCGDSFGRAATRLWLALAYADLKQTERLTTCLDDLLILCETHHYDFLLTAPSLLGVADIRRVVPLLLSARVQHLHSAYINRLLTELELSQIQVHPGYQLRVQMLGHFQVWRGSEEVDAREWKRDKARQLFQLLLIHRGQPLQREAITEQLWPSLSPEAATRDFKVALNALNKTLEPRHEADSPFAFIVREGTSYFIRPEADLWLDSAEFQRNATVGVRSGDLPDDQVIGALQKAIHIYAGDFLAETPYEDWASTERERLLAFFLRAADKLASLYLAHEQFDDCLNTCQLILNRDSCWERAYRLMMVAHARQGNRPQALRDYQRCLTALSSELNVAPSTATVELYQQLTQGGETVVTGL